MIDGEGYVVADDLSNLVNILLQQIDAPILGTILTGVASEETYGSFYEYYGYKASSVPVFGRFIDRRQNQVPVIESSRLPEDDEDSEDEDLQVTT